MFVLFIVILFSFEVRIGILVGDYFKSEACAWAYELVTERYGLDPDRLWVSVFETDDEAIDIWADEVGIARDRIVRRGRKDNVIVVDEHQIRRWSVSYGRR